MARQVGADISYPPDSTYSVVATHVVMGRWVMVKLLCKQYVGFSLNTAVPVFHLLWIIILSQVVVSN